MSEYIRDLDSLESPDAPTLRGMRWVLRELEITELRVEYLKDDITNSSTLTEQQEEKYDAAKDRIKYLYGRLGHYASLDGLPVEAPVHRGSNWNPIAANDEPQL